jgi:hypothetical protein
MLSGEVLLLCRYAYISRQKFVHLPAMTCQPPPVKALTGAAGRSANETILSAWSGCHHEIPGHPDRTWGKKDDYCGDGFCAGLQTDDARIVLRFTVSVPKSFKGTFDPSPCPGDMHVATGPPTSLAPTPLKPSIAAT